MKVRQDKVQEKVTYSIVISSGKYVIPIDQYTVPAYFSARLNPKPESCSKIWGCSTMQLFPQSQLQMRDILH